MKIDALPDKDVLVDTHVTGQLLEQIALPDKTKV